MELTSALASGLLKGIAAVRVALRIRGSRAEDIWQEDLRKKGGEPMHETCMSVPLPMSSRLHTEDTLEVQLPQGTQAGQRRLFKVDQVVNEDASLDFAYQHTAGSLVQRVQREGGSGCFITLGLPCSGKTFLMEGEQGDPGIVMRAVQDLLSCGPMIYAHPGGVGRQLRSTAPWSVAMSHYEVYHDKVYDLLNDREEVSVQEDDSGQVILDGLSEVHVGDVAKANTLLQQSHSARHQLGNRSYSHCFTTLYLYKEGGPLPEVTRHSLSGGRRAPHARLTFVDVAGMEPAGSIVNSKLEIEDIAWLYESGHAIHTCLSRHLWLQQDGPKHPLDVPYNSSKVTQILKDVFVEQTSLALCLSVSPASKDFCGETLQLLEQFCLPEKLRPSGDARQNNGYPATQHQPQGSARNAGQPAAALGPGEEADAAPVPRKPARDLSRPRAEQLLHAEQEETQRWRGQAMRLGEELGSASSERQTLFVQLGRACASLAGSAPQSSGDRVDVAALLRQRDSALEQLRHSEKARAGDAAAAKKAQAELYMSSQKIALQRGILLTREREARAAAERRATDLEQELSAQKVRAEALEKERMRISTEREEVTEEYEVALLALAHSDMDLTASKASQEQAEQLLTQLRAQLKEATAAKRVAEQQNMQLISQLEEATSAKARMGAELREAQQACQAAQAAAVMEAERAADLDASRAAMEKQLADVQKTNKVRDSKVAKALEEARKRVQYAIPQCVFGAQRQHGPAPSALGLAPPVGHHKDTGSQAISAVIGDEHANAPAAVDHQAGGKRTAPCTPAASAGGRNLPSAVVSAEPPAVLTQACQARPSKDSPMAGERATPAKRARNEGASPAPAPELAAAPDALSGTQQVERRVRRRVHSSVEVPDQDASAPAVPAQSYSMATAAPQTCMAAAGPGRHPLEAGLVQPAAARSGQRCRGAASKMRAPGSRPVTRSVATSNHPAAGPPPVQEHTLATGAQIPDLMEVEASVAPANQGKSHQTVARMCTGPRLPKIRAAVLPPVPECSLATGAQYPVHMEVEPSAALPNMRRKMVARKSTGASVPKNGAAPAQWRP